MKILVCGDREWKDFLTIHTVLKEYEHTAQLVVHGAARGADTLAGDAAEALRIPVASFPAEWDKYGAPAGPIRNREMFDKTQPDLVLAFHDNFINSRGTKDMVSYARSKGVKCILHMSNGKSKIFNTLFW